MSLAGSWRAEWTKACTVSSTGWLLGGAVASGAGLSAALCAVARQLPGEHGDSVRLALSGVQVAQAVIAVWAVRAVSGEYRSGMVRTTLVAVPRRRELVVAKAGVVAVLASAAGAVTVAGGLLVGGVGLTAGAVVRAAVGSVLYLGLVGLLAAGTALAVRDGAAATGVVLGLLYLFPLAAQMAGNAAWQRRLEQVGPSTAGLGVQATTGLGSLPIGPWAGLGVLAGWAAGAVAAGSLVLKLRES